MIRDLQRVLEPSYVGGLADAPIEQIRAMRAECTELENGASFVRRLAQGRLDLLSEEATRRADGAGGSPSHMPALRVAPTAPGSGG